MNTKEKAVDLVHAVRVCAGWHFGNFVNSRTECIIIIEQALLDARNEALEECIDKLESLITSDDVRNDMSFAQRQGDDFANDALKNGLKKIRALKGKTK